MSKLSHLDSAGNARMVDVGGKDHTQREARAKGEVTMSPQTLELITTNDIPKGDVLAVARIAGIMAAKKTPEIIPLCHPISITKVEVNLSLNPKRNCIVIEATVGTVGPTGVEMEALCAVSAAGLSVYDMCKAVDKNMVISDIKLIEKQGGRSGHYKREED